MDELYNNLAYLRSFVQLNRYLIGDITDKIIEKLDELRQIIEELDEKEETE
jgi:hypothetical protein